MKTIIFLLSFFFLVGCRTTYVEIYYVEKYPMYWRDTIIYNADHWHFQDRNNTWFCVDLEPDTLVLDMKDTLLIPTYKGTYKK
jgi:hypothetical protein